MDPGATRIMLLGTASGIPTPTRNNVSLALVHGGRVYLFDAGEPCAAALVRKGVSPEDLAAVFISHMHADHAGGLAMLIQWLDLAGRRSPLPVYLPAGAEEGFRRCMAFMYLNEETIRFRMELRPSSEGPIHCDDAVAVSAWRTTHLRHLAARFRELGISTGEAEPQAFSFKASVDGRTIVYTGDMGEPEDLDRFIEDTDLLLCELAHFPPEKLFEYLRDKSVPRVVCLHIHPDWDTRAQECLELGRQYLGDRIVVGHDGMELTL